MSPWAPGNLEEPFSLLYAPEKQMDWTKTGYFYDKLLPHNNSVKNAISQMYRSNELFGPMMKSLTISVNSLLHLGEQPECVTLDNSLTAVYTVMAGPQRKLGGTVEVRVLLHF